MYSHEPVKTRLARSEDCASHYLVEHGPYPVGVLWVDFYSPGSTPSGRSHHARVQPGGQAVKPGLSCVGIVRRGLASGYRNRHRTRSALAPGGASPPGSTRGQRPLPNLDPASGEFAGGKAPRRLKCITPAPRNQTPLHRLHNHPLDRQAPGLTGRLRCDCSGVKGRVRARVERTAVRRATGLAPLILPRPGRPPHHTRPSPRLWPRTRPP